MKKIENCKLFGTDGIRGKANTFPINVETCISLAQAIAETFNAANTNCKNVIIGRDTRLSSSMLENAMSAGFCSMGINIMQLGVTSTPSISILTKELNADLGIMISASHNPYYDNGIKIFTADGLKLSNNTELAIEKSLKNIKSRRFKDKNTENVGSISQKSVAIAQYYDILINSVKFSKNISKYKIAIDTANGSFSDIAEEIFGNLKFNFKIFNNNPNGRNINDNCGATCPNFISQITQKTNSDFGVAFDGDGDRLIICDSKGRIFNGDKILAILIEAYNLKNTTVISTIMSNFGLEKFLCAKNIKLIKTNVGDKHIVQAMCEHNSSIGGEPSGHIILKDFAYTGDGMATCLKILEYIINNDISLTSLYDIFTPYPSTSVNIKVQDKNVLLAQNIQNEIKKYEKQLKNIGKLIVRASGTESLIRISAEGENLTELQKIVNTIAKLIERS